MLAVSFIYKSQAAANTRHNQKEVRDVILISIIRLKIRSEFQ